MVIGNFYQDIPKSLPIPDKYKIYTAKVKFLGKVKSSLLSAYSLFIKVSCYATNELVTKKVQ